MLLISIQTEHKTRARSYFLYDDFPHVVYVLAWQNTRKEFNTHHGVDVNSRQREIPAESGDKNIYAYGEKLCF